MYGMKTVLFIVVMTMRTRVIGGGKNSNLSILKALNIWVVMILWKLNISENFDPFLLCNSLIVLKSYCWNAIYPTKNKRSQTFFFNPRQMDIKETSYAMQVTKTQIQINIL